MTNEQKSNGTGCFVERTRDRNIFGTYSYMDLHCKSVALPHLDCVEASSRNSRLKYPFEPVCSVNVLLTYKLSLNKLYTVKCAL